MILRCAYHCVMSKKAQKGDGTTLQVVEGLLNALCGMPPQRCPNCGRKMTQTSATFFLPGSDSTNSWTAPLPICSKCDQAMGQIIATA